MAFHPQILDRNSVSEVKMRYNLSNHHKITPKSTNSLLQIQAKFTFNPNEKSQTAEISQKYANYTPIQFSAQKIRQMGKTRQKSPPVPKKQASKQPTKNEPPVLKVNN